MKQTTTNTNFERKLISFDENDYNKAIRFVQQDIDQFNKLLKSIITNLPDVKVDLEILEAIYKNPQEFAFDYIVGDTPLTIAGVTVNKKKAMDLIDMPKGWLNVIKVANQVKTEFENKTVHGSHNDTLVDRLDISDVEIDNGKVKLNDMYIESLKEENSRYTKNNNQNIALDKVCAIRDVLNELKSMGVYFGAEATALSQLGFTLGDDFKLDPTAFISEIK